MQANLWWQKAPQWLRWDGGKNWGRCRNYQKVWEILEVMTMLISLIVIIISCLYTYVKIYQRTLEVWKPYIFNVYNLEYFNFASIKLNSF